MNLHSPGQFVWDEFGERRLPHVYSLLQLKEKTKPWRIGRQFPFFSGDAESLPGIRAFYFRPGGDALNVHLSFSRSIGTEEKARFTGYGNAKRIGIREPCGQEKAVISIGVDDSFEHLRRSKGNFTSAC
jgi:hypothetical protein